jgi:alpha-glucosidase (family GH31 glycosyl hydrolase)
VIAYWRKVFLERERLGRSVRIARKIVSIAALGMGAAMTCQSVRAQQPAFATRDALKDGKANPVADPAAVVIAGHARFTVLTPQLIRMEWSADKKFEDHASFVFLNRRLQPPRFDRLSGADGTLTITTDALTLRYSPSGDGRFTDKSLAISSVVSGKVVEWHPGMVDSENLKGTARTLDRASGGNTLEPIEPGLVSRAGWVLVDDSTRPLFDTADFTFSHGEKSPWPWVLLRPAGERQDLYFFGYGHDYRKALGDFVRVAGRIPLPPPFAFGTWWSRYWDYTDQELVELVKGFRYNNVPLNVMVIDMGWHISKDQLQAKGEKDASNHALGWTGYTWNPVLFPDPVDFLKKMHAQGLKITLNLHPASGVQPWEQAYPDFARAVGIDPATRQYVPFDPTNKKWAINYFDLVLHPLEKEGIDFWWLDWQQEPDTKIPGVNNTWWLNYLHFTDQQREGKRPLLFHRWGGLGNHRYQIGFSGDTISVWDSLAFQPWFTATAANVGYAYWSHDIGGHMPGAVDPELYTRWVQFGAFSPILRTHTTKNADAERRAWAYPEPYSSILRNIFQLRNALEPYIYTEARRTYDTGVAFVRPLYYDWPDADPAYASKGEYLFGDEMLVAPVTHPSDTRSGLATESVWLPKGDWIEWSTGKRISGPQTMERTFMIDQTPVYVKAGAIVPMRPQTIPATASSVTTLVLNVWPLAPGTDSTYSVYEDSGVSEDYQVGVFARTPVKAIQTSDTLRIEIGPIEGHYPGMANTRAYELHLPDDWPPAKVTVNGLEVYRSDAPDEKGWRFDGNTLTTVIPIKLGVAKTKNVIEVHRAPSLMLKRDELDGFPGALARLRAVYDTMRSADPVTVPPDALIDAMQTGDRLGYHPETAARELAHFHEALEHASVAVESSLASAYEKLDRPPPNLMGPPPEETPNLVPEKGRRLSSIQQAQALMQTVGK